MTEASERTDWLGVEHAPVRGEVRIASLVPSLTETLFALGLGPNIVARTGFCVHPRSEVKRVAKVGGTKDPDLSRLRALAPTHLVVNIDENRREDVEAARAFVPHVVVTDPRDPGDNVRLVQLLGAIFDRMREARSLAEALEVSLAHLHEAVTGLARERVLYLIWRKPWMTVSRDTYISATLSCARLDTVPAISDRRYPVLPDDDEAWRLADRVLLSSEPYAFRERDAAELRAATAKPVHLIDGEWTSWYGARACEGLRALARWRTTL
jgi:ABC-type Fe3+-hydroxamate transport system substrate-binding protein